MEEAVDTIPSILNKCLFVSPPDPWVSYKLTGEPSAQVS